MKEEKKISNFIDFRYIIIILLMIILVVFLLFNFSFVLDFLYSFFRILTPIFIGIFLAYVVNPIYNFVYEKVYNSLNKYKKNDRHIVGFAKTISVLACIFVWILVIIGLVLLIIPELYKSMSSFIISLPKYQVKVFDFIKSYGLLQNNQALVSEALSYFNNLYEYFSTFINQFFNNIVKNIYSGLVTTVSWIFNIFIGIIIMVYLLLKKNQLIYYFRKLMYALFDKPVAIKILTEIDYTNEIFKKFFMGKILDSLIIFILSYIIFSIMNMTYSTLLATLIGITNVIPFFGPIFGAIISALLVLLISPYQFIVFIIVVFFIQQIDGNILGPKILGNSTGVDNFQVLCSTLIFGGLFGFVGMILAVPICAVFTRLLNQFLNYKLEQKKLSTNIDDYKNRKLE